MVRIDDLKRVYVSAEDVSIEDILNKISTQTGMKLDSAADLSETISIHIENETIEKCLQLILDGKNYVVLFRKTGDNKFTPVELKIYPTITETGEGKNQTPLNVPSDQPVNVSGPKGITNYDRASFERAFGDRNSLLAQIKADETIYGEGTEDIGIRISGLAEDSVFKRIGLETGDIVRDVNGRQVKSLKEFIDAIQAVLAEQLPTIRIARMKHNGRHQPLYININ